MSEQSSISRKLQWKWVAITFVLYLVFYLLPIFAAPALLNGRISAAIGGVWIFGGIIIVAAVAAYLSKGITILEPAIASALMVIILFVITVLSVPGARFDIKRETLSALGVIGIVFVLSLVGAWIGERLQKLYKSKDQ